MVARLSCRNLCALRYPAPLAHHGGGRRRPAPSWRTCTEKMAPGPR